MNDLKLLRHKNVADTYSILSEVGSGTYGTVYKALRHADQKFVALKKFELNKQTKCHNPSYNGFPITAIREIKLLELTDHPNIIKLLEIIATRPSIANNYKSSTFLVFDYMEHDFLGFLSQKVHFTIPQIKCIMNQILNGVAYLHDKNIIHRDIKAANILFNNQGEVKLADFGLGILKISQNKQARQIRPSTQANYTNKVITLWYRAPELLFALGATNYSQLIDVWSIGCIFGELLTGQILFKGDKEVRQLELIQSLCGKVDKQVWFQIIYLLQIKFIIGLMLISFHYIRNLVVFYKLQIFFQASNLDTYKYKLREFIMSKRPELSANGYNLLSKMLSLDPKKRITCEEARKHIFFSETPIMCSLEELPKFSKECHDTLLKQQFAKEKFQNQYGNQSTNQQFQKVRQFNNNNNPNSTLNNNNSNNNNSQISDGIATSQQGKINSELTLIQNYQISNNKIQLAIINQIKKKLIHKKISLIRIGCLKIFLKKYRKIDTIFKFKFQVFILSSFQVYFTSLCFLCTRNCIFYINPIYCKLYKFLRF